MTGDGLNYEISDSRLVHDPLISIVILVYNHEAYLSNALESVLNQQHEFPVEILLGEDCSVDDSRQIALRYFERYPESIRIITADHNVGAFENARRLLRATRGKFIASLDGDDYWLPGKVSKQMTFLAENPECIAVYANALTIDREGYVFGVFNDVTTRKFDIGAMLRRGNFLNSSSVMYRAELKPALLNEKQKLMDYIVHLFIARYGCVGHLAEPLVGYRVNSTNSMLAKDNAEVRDLYWQAIQSVPRSLVSDSDYAHALADFLRRVFFRSVRTRQWSLWRQWKSRVFAVSPYRSSKVYLLTIHNILRMVAKEVFGFFKRDAQGRRVRVLYRR